MRKYFLVISIFFTVNILAQTPSLKMAATVLNIWKDSTPIGSNVKWSYDMGVVLKGFESIWQNTGDVKYFNAIQKKMDYWIKEDGSIKGYEKEEYNIDMINNAKLVLLLYRVTGKEKYKKAADLLRSQLDTHPRTNEGGFWHKKIYTNQMWLDGLYMGEPFYAEYAMLFHQDKDFDDIANQFIWMEQHSRDKNTGLLYHGWDESKQQQWANKVTGSSPQFWSRAMGWYSDAIVDVLDYFPTNHPKRKILIDILNRLVTALEKYQDKKYGVWYDILNYNGVHKEKNYLEASASCQFVYAILKGVRKGYLPKTKINIAKNAYSGILKQFIKEENGQTNLYGTVKGSGLGGNPYRDGSFDYYMSEPVIINDPKGIGAFLLASTEIEILPTLENGNGKTVLLDRYFNSEKKKDITGANVYWHYDWTERANGGFSTFGKIFENNGAKLATLDIAPTFENLKNAAVYIIVDPDNIKDNPNPNYVNEKQVNEIGKWVNAGGSLLLMANDSNNCDLLHFNYLSTKFGIKFTDKSINMVKNDNYNQGLVIANNNLFFKDNYKMYLKEISALQILNSSAKKLVTKDDDVILATATYGKGKVFVVGDPWLYNEYLDARKLPAEFQNYNAAQDVVKWLLSSTKK